MNMLKFLASVFTLLLILVLVGGLGAIYVFSEYGHDLPDYKQLASYDPPTVTRVHAGDGRIIQYDADFKEKGVLWTGKGHLIGGLKFAPDGVLWAFDSQEFRILNVAPSGEQLADPDSMLLVLVHRGLISEPVQEMLRAFLLTPHRPRRYCLIDGQAAYRLLKAHNAL